MFQIQHCVWGWGRRGSSDQVKWHSLAFFIFFILYFAYYISKITCYEEKSLKPHLKGLKEKWHFLFWKDIEGKVLVSINNL